MSSNNESTYRSRENMVAYRRSVVERRTLIFSFVFYLIMISVQVGYLVSYGFKSYCTKPLNQWITVNVTTCIISLCNFERVFRKKLQGVVWRTVSFTVWPFFFQLPRCLPNIILLAGIYFYNFLILYIIFQLALVFFKGGPVARGLCFC